MTGNDNFSVSWQLFFPCFFFHRGNHCFWMLVSYPVNVWKIIRSHQPWRCHPRSNPLIVLAAFQCDIVHNLILAQIHSLRLWRTERCHFAFWIYKAIQGFPEIGRVPALTRRIRLSLEELYRKVEHFHYVNFRPFNYGFFDVLKRRAPHTFYVWLDFRFGRSW